MDQSGDRLTFSRSGDGDEWSLQLMWLDQYEDAIGPQVLTDSIEGMDHALECDSSKRPAEERNLEFGAAEAKPFRGSDMEGHIVDSF
jgi:hypothetical protein